MGIQVTEGVLGQGQPRALPPLLMHTVCIHALHLLHTCESECALGCECAHLWVQIHAHTQSH